MLSQGEASANHNMGLSKFVLNTLLCSCIWLLALHGWTINTVFFIQVLSVDWLANSLNDQLGLETRNFVKKAVDSIW